MLSFFRRHHPTEGPSISYYIIDVWPNSVVSLAVKEASFPHPVTPPPHVLTLACALTFALVSHLRAILNTRHGDTFRKH